ncbi:MAG: cofactor-independent phosphoglycerate mutase [Spirochaetes bacterium]|nr:cofactor-independent phosphoglycerate mutase [Spirochaetota bacterium]
MSEHKIAILVGDGMADFPVKELEGKTPLQYAKTHHMDYLAKNGICGIARTVPKNMPPGSDVANLSLFGYDPATCYTGRAPLEALNMGIDLGPDDVAFRCNLVTIEHNIMQDFAAGHIDSAFSKIVIEEIAQAIKIDGVEFYAGVSYRNIMVVRNFSKELPTTTPPHDIQGKAIEEYLPKGQNSDLLNDIMQKAGVAIAHSKKISDAKRTLRGNPTAIWLWGGGFRPKMQPLSKLYGLHGHTISAVDLIHGIGRAAGLTPIYVEGATGYIDTNYAGKAQALIDGMKNANFIFLHVEAPDESGHEGNLEHKLKAIEDFDAKIVGPVVNMLNRYGNYTVLVMPDHPTPLSLRTHTADPVPFVIYSPDMSYRLQCKGFNEVDAAKTGIVVEKAHELLGMIVKKAYRW